MTGDSGPNPFHAHLDAVYFREAVSFTAARTGFAARLIEKDYFCTVLLAHLTTADGRQIVFKGGTCLTKVLLDFYRLSEDLDFAIPVPVSATRMQRSRAAAALKDAVSSSALAQDGFKIARPLSGSNNSTQYIGEISYRSPRTGELEPIKVEVSLREPLLTPIIQGTAHTVLLDPLGGQPLVPDLSLPCISLIEAMAEKIRAALTRREVAIRDFYDLHHAVMVAGIDLGTSELLELIRCKLAVPGNVAVQVSDRRKAQLRAQLATHLRPVLRQADLERFDLDDAFEMVARIAQTL